MGIGSGSAVGRLPRPRPRGPRAVAEAQGRSSAAEGCSRCPTRSGAWFLHRVASISCELARPPSATVQFASPARARPTPWCPPAGRQWRFGCGTFSRIAAPGGQGIVPPQQKAAVVGAAAADGPRALYFFFCHAVAAGGGAAKPRHGGPVAPPRRTLAAPRPRCAKTASRASTRSGKGGLRQRMPRFAARRGVGGLYVVHKGRRLSVAPVDTSACAACAKHHGRPPIDHQRRSAGGVCAVAAAAAARYYATAAVIAAAVVRRRARPPYRNRTAIKPRSVMLAQGPWAEVQTAIKPQSAGL